MQLATPKTKKRKRWRLTMNKYYIQLETPQYYSCEVEATSEEEAEEKAYELANKGLLEKCDVRPDYSIVQIEVDDV